MAEVGLDVLLVTYINNACYLTGYQTPLANWYVCVAVPMEGDMVAHVLDLELTNLYVHGWPASAPAYLATDVRHDRLHGRTDRGSILAPVPESGPRLPR